MAKTIREKVEGEYPEFVDDVIGLNEAQLRARLSTYAIELTKSEQAKEEDQEYQAAKTLASDLGAPYRDVEKALKLKRKYIIELIKDKGGDIGN